MSLRILVIVAFIGFIGRADRMDDIAKDVGKRFLSWNPKLRGVPDKYSNLIQDQIYHLRLEKDWMNLTDEEVADKKRKQARDVADWIYFQSSFENRYWQDKRILLYMLCHPQLQVQICDQTEKINYVQFMNFLDRRRNTFRQNDVIQYSYFIYPTGRKTLNFVLNFAEDSIWGFHTETIYNVSMELHATVNMPNHNFLIRNVSILGGCTDIGTIDLAQTTIENYAEWNENSDVKDLFKLFTPGELRYAWQDSEKIPHLWLEGLDEDEFFSGRVCWSPATKSPRYRTEAFKSWYQRFGIIWHPKKGDKDFVRIQLLKADAEELKARVTVRLQAGVNENATTHDWEMMLVTQFNKRGDRKWRVSEVEISCPATLNPNHMTHAFWVMPEVATKAFTSLVTNKDMWWNALYFLKDFTKSEPENWICEQKTSSIESMQRKLWSEDSPFNATIAGYTMATQPGKASEDTWFSFDLVLSCATCSTKYYSANWKFYMKWDRNDQFYNVWKVVLNCPEERATGPYVRFG